jgi:hypothetical protein
MVMAATPEKLIEIATDNSKEGNARCILSSVDSSYLDTLLLTFRSFMRPTEFFDALVDRFNSIIPDDVTPEELESFRKMVVAVQLKVLHVLGHWIGHYWHDFSTDAVLKRGAIDFAEAVKNNDAFRYPARELLQKIRSQMEREEAIKSFRNIMDTKKKAMEFVIEDIDVSVLAKQVTLHDFELFQQVHTIEFLNKLWKKKDSDTSEWATPNLDYFSQRFDLESYWAASEILKVEDVKKRAKILQKFIHLAKEFQTINNFFSMFATYAGLSMGSITRLQKTWDQLPPKTKQLYSEIEKLCDPSRNMKAYRELLLTRMPPSLPFIPIYMKDLIFMNDGNPSFFKNMVNFDKLRMIGNRVREVTSLGFIPFTFEKDPILQNVLHKPKIETNNAKLKELSLLREP